MYVAIHTHSHTLSHSARPQFIDEADRSLHDAIMIVRRALKHAIVVPGGGAIEMEVGGCMCGFYGGGTAPVLM